MFHLVRTCAQSIPFAMLLLVIPDGVAAEPVEPTFERHIRPVFREYCLDCHGANEEKQGNLDLRLVRLMASGGDSGAAINLAEPLESLLLQRVVSAEMPPGEAHLPAETIALLERWLAAGAKTERPEPEQIGPGIPISREDREYWAFRPVARPDVPAFAPEMRARTPIDALLLQAMPAGLSFSPDADRATLIRRVYFDLIGLPPTTDEFVRWNQLTDADWYQQLIDHLLDSPHYGERWGRHWLDVAGYADSEGQTTQDADRPWSWKYRDYVMRSLNDNKPFNRFIVEQLAGDELAGPKHGDWTPEQIELLTATSFLRMAADGTGSGDNSPEAHNKVIADTLKIVSSSLLGVSVGCAQCHDHRYDPISQIDYFALRAIFEPALDWQNWRVPNARRVSLYTEADRAEAQAIEEEAQQVAAVRTAKQNDFMAQALDKELMKYEEPLRERLRTAYQTAAKDRSSDQVQLLKQYPSVNISPGVLYQYLPEAAEELKKFDAQISEIRARKPKEEFVRALAEQPGQIPVTHLFHRGDHQQPKQKVSPADLSVAAPEGRLPTILENDPALPTSGRRLSYANWLTSGEHPLVARVIVNRVWLHHFGRAIVATPSDFGKLGSAPTHPQLLDWLADEFMRSGWDLKHLHRLILTSTAWRQSSVRDREKVAIDAENVYYWRRPIQRLDAEILRDRMLFASGTLDREFAGPPVAIKEDETGQVIVDGQQTRRSIYIRVRRSQPVAMLQSFDAPVMDVNCQRRPVSTVATQSLILLNGEFTLQQADLLAERIIQETAAWSSAPLPSLPDLPQPLPNAWSYGFGRFDEQSGRVVDFAVLPHWTGSEWQGGEQRPDPKIGWVIINAGGGHPGGSLAAIRRWTSASDCQIAVSGSLSHGSPSGDGVRGRIVSSRHGLLGQWNAHNGAASTEIAELNVASGETIDFVTDCLTNENSDSFSWTAKLTVRDSGGEQVRDTAAEFHGPLPSEDYSALPNQLRHAWQTIYCRPPSDEELRLSVAHVSAQLRELHRHATGIVQGSTAAKQVLANFCHALMNSNEFVYVD